MNADSTSFLFCVYLPALALPNPSPDRGRGKNPKTHQIAHLGVVDSRHVWASYPVSAWVSHFPM